MCLITSLLTVYLLIIQEANSMLHHTTYKCMSDPCFLLPVVTNQLHHKKRAELSLQSVGSLFLQHGYLEALLPSCSSAVLLPAASSECSSW